MMCNQLNLWGEKVSPSKPTLHSYIGNRDDDFTLDLSGAVGLSQQDLSRFSDVERSRFSDVERNIIVTSPNSESKWVGVLGFETVSVWPESCLL